MRIELFGVSPSTTSSNSNPWSIPVFIEADTSYKVTLFENMNNHYTTTLPCISVFGNFNSNIDGQDLIHYVISCSSML